MSEENSNWEGTEGREDTVFFIDLLPKLEHRVSVLVQELKKPLTYILPVDFQAHLEQAKSIDKIDHEWMETFKDVIALKVQGRINTPLMRLADQIRSQFGGQIIFWLDVLCCFAQNEKYHQNLRIWQINDAYKSCLHLPVSEYEKNRHFRKLAKQDICVTKKLITLITELTLVKSNEEGSKRSPDQQLGKIQLNYKLHLDSNKKVVEFFMRNQKEKCLDFFGQSNLLYPGKKTPATQFSSSCSKKTKDKERLNNPKQKMITDFSVQMNDPRNFQLINKISGRQEKPSDPQKSQELGQFFGSMNEQDGEAKPSIEFLRDQIRQGKSKLLHKIHSVYSNIFIEYSYLQYHDFPNLAESCPFKHFTHPFLEHEDINYEIDDYELYEDLEADLVDESDSEEDSQDDTLDSNEKRELCNLEDDGYELDFEDQFVKNNAYRTSKLFKGNQWVYNFHELNPFWINNKIQEQDSQISGSKNSFTQTDFEQMVREFDGSIICPNPMPMPVLLDQDQEKASKEDQATIKQIFHGKSKKQGLQIVKASEQLSSKFKKNKIKQVISTMTIKRVKIGDKWVFVYFNSEEEKENVSKGQNLLKVQKIEGSNNGDQDESDIDIDDQETEAYDEDYRPKSRLISMNLNSRSSSQRISNLKSEKMKSQEQQKSQTSYFSNKAKSVTDQDSQNTRKSFLRESKLISSQTVTNPPVSRLRPRVSKPNYNLEELLRSEKKQEKDIEI